MKDRKVSQIDGVDDKRNRQHPYWGCVVQPAVQQHMENVKLKDHKNEVADEVS